MLFVIALVGIALLGFTLWYSLRVTKLRDLPPWRRFLPLSLLALSTAASLLRAADIPQIANAVAFPLLLAAIAVSVAEVRAEIRRRGAVVLGEK
ncbi:hypothetical protein OIE62_12345 [Streptomyces scopuliridis]|uniref:Uncharacterized protein n=1 Tax=Streptomyces scopuliridis TaxID=452529 RepID=A0ACD4ZQ72_9ACTN|nr:hypothetical protein [Streptomyces scopuliridis]WSB36357.1 hypothetical protein OG949_28305 [Streptomyces scopuliridis]WSC00653.1 hypothetical protein OG835_29050 [Streptomyces scopuliridis]WSC05736.1 hypothetical protein OIE62_12345 [Streptomyces scopuliridis]